MRSATISSRRRPGIRRALLATLLGLSGVTLQAQAARVDDGASVTSLRLARGPAQGQGRAQAQGQVQGQGQGQGQQKAKAKQTSGEQDDRTAQDRDRDQDRERVRPDDSQPIYGRELMTELERREYQERMRNLRTEEERQVYREEHHREMQSRAAERGLTLPEPSSQLAPGDARQQHGSDKSE